MQSKQHNLDNSALVERIADAQQLNGMTRDEIEAAIGKGDRCSRHQMCGEQGFESEDWFYEVGTMGPAFVGARPILLLGFDRFGKVARTYTLRID